MAPRHLHLRIPTARPRLRPGLRARLGAVALAAALLGGCQDQQGKLAEHLERAAGYMEEDKPAEAVIEYKNALQIAPNDAATHYGLAQAYMKTKEPQKAYWELQESVRLDGGNLDARLALGQFLLLGGEAEFEQAIEQADAVIAGEPARWEAYVLRGAALERLKRTEQAQADYEKALELEPEKPELLRTLAGYHVRRGDREAAEPLYDELVERKPTAGNHLLRAGFLALDRERDADAEAAYAKAFELATDEEKPDVTQRLASFYFARERYDEAEKTLQTAIEQRPEDLDLLYSLARFYHSRGAPEKADAMIQQATAARPQEVKPYLILSAYRGRNGDLAGALEAAERALAVAPEDTTARLRKAELLVDLGAREGAKDRLAQARAIVDAVLAQDPDAAEGYFVRAKLDLAEGKTDEAVAALRRALDRRPEWAQAHFLLASALVVQNDRQQARAEVLRAVELDPQFLDARRLLAKVHALLGEHDLAIEESRRVLRQQPDDVATRIVLAQSLVYLGRADEARTELETIPLEKRDAQVYFAIARIDMLQGKSEFAREKLLKALADQPSHPEILESLLSADVAAGDVKDAVARIELAATENPESAPHQRLYGIALLAAGDAAAAEARLRRAIELDPNALPSYQALARLLFGTNRIADGIRTYEQAVERQPASAGLRFTLGTLYESNGRRADAVAQYEEAVRLDPSLAVAKNNLAYLMAEDGQNLDRALDLAQEAKAQLPDSPNVADTLGWVLLKKGIPEAAVDYLQEAEGALPPGHPDLGVIRTHLAMALEASNQPDKARQVAERALAALEEARQVAREQGGELKDPPWAADARSLIQRVSAAAPGTQG